MRIRQTAVNFLHALNRQNIAGWLFAEFIRAVRCANCNRQRVALRFLHKIGGLFRVGQQLLAAHRAFGAVAVLLSPRIVSSEPRQPSSASTVTPIACAKPATCCVTSTLYTYEATVFPSSRSEPSIITLLKPLRIAVKHTAGDWP